MSIVPDPYRVLGLGRGASADDIRRAYRRLVKENHPDSAGPGALPRFLAIQAAYEALEGGPSARRSAGRPATPSRPRPPDPWRADPGRAQAARDGPRRPGRPGSRTGTGAPGSGGSAARSDGARPQPRPGSPPDPAGTRPAGPAAGSGAPRDGGGGGARRAPGDRPRRDGRKRSSNKATLGSTSYDAAENEPFEPEWSGGTWYGASSGTYWTINPKEYADPRKHGPEYQARARRRTTGGIGDDGTDVGAPVPPWAGPADPDDQPFENSPTGATSEANGDSTGRGPWTARGSAATEGSGRTSGSARRAPFTSTSTWDAAAWEAASDGLDEPPHRPDRPDRDPFSAAAQLAMVMAGTPRGFAARVGLALVGWPAIGLALTTTAGEITGCGRFAAGCVDLFGVGTWLAQLVIIAILLALPSLAALSVVGSLVALAASVPTAIILSASGGSHEPAASATILGGVLVAAYAGGIGAALVRRRRSAGLP